MFTEELIPVLHKFQKAEVEHCPSHSIRQVLVSTLTLKPRKDITGKENYTSVSLMNTKGKVYKILANPYEWRIKTIVHHDPVGLIPRMQG